MTKNKKSESFKSSEEHTFVYSSNLFIGIVLKAIYIHFIIKIDLFFHCFIKWHLHPVGISWNILYVQNCILFRREKNIFLQEIL